MRCFLLTLVLSAAASMMGFAADQTFTGRISDSMCGASHAKMKAAHEDAKMTDRDCTLACIKGGGKYVFVQAGMVYQISNQDFSGLKEYAGDTVRLTGEKSGNTITVSKIEPAKGKKKS